MFHFSNKLQSGEVKSVLSKNCLQKNCRYFYSEGSVRLDQKTSHISGNLSLSVPIERDSSARRDKGEIGSGTANVLVLKKYFSYLIRSYYRVHLS